MAEQSKIEPLSPWGQRVWAAIQYPFWLFLAWVVPTRWAAREWLEVTDVRVQRLGVISDADARAEGLSTVTKDGKLYKWGIPDRDGWPGTDDYGWPWCDWDVSPKKAFFRLWDAIHGKGAAEKNPTVWVYQFRRIENPEAGR